MNQHQQRPNPLVKEALPFFSHCMKSNKHVNLESDVNQAITFLYLRSK